MIKLSTRIEAVTRPALSCRSVPRPRAVMPTTRLIPWRRIAGYDAAPATHQLPNPKAARASAALAGSRPNSRAILAIASTSCELRWAGEPSGR